MTSPPRRPHVFAALILITFVVACGDDPIPGRCQSSTDCKSTERCELASGPNLKRCVPRQPDGGNDGAAKSDAGPSDTPTPNEGGASGSDGGSPEVSAPMPDLAPACQSASDCKTVERSFCQAGVCVGCHVPQAGTCPTTRPVCDASSGACVECVASAGCTRPDAPICAAGTCVGCTAHGGDASCTAKSVTTPRCGPQGRCVECNAAADCNQAGKSFCTMGTCGGCQTAGPGACTGSTPACNPSTGACAECVADGDCKQPNAPFCVANRCASCAMAPGRCATATPATPVCGAAGACVECLSSADCTGDPNRPICNTAEQICRPCGADTECVARNANDPGVCLDHKGGRCATVAETIYVDTSTGVTCGAAGTKALPLCSAQDAPKMVTATRNLVLVRGIVEGFAWLLGPTTPAITVVGAGEAPAIAGGAKVGVRIDGAGEVLLRKLAVVASATVGIHASGGATLKLRNVLVEGNRGGGVLLEGARFELRDTVISENGPGQTGAASWGGMLVLGTKAVPALLENVSIRANKQVGLACAYTVTGNLVYARNNAGGIEVQESCGITTCEPEGPGCGARR